MSVKAAIRPSALPLPKTSSSQSLSSYDRKCMLPVAVDRNRRAGSDPRTSGSTPTRSINSSLVRNASIRSTTSNQDTNSSKVRTKESNKENKAKEGAFNRSKIIINNNNINVAKTKGLCLLKAYVHTVPLICP